MNSPVQPQSDCATQGSGLASLLTIGSRHCTRAGIDIERFLKTQSGIIAAGMCPCNDLQQPAYSCGGITEHVDIQQAGCAALPDAQEV